MKKCWCEFTGDLRFDKDILEYESYRMITSGLKKIRLMEI